MTSRQLDAWTLWRVEEDNHPDLTQTLLQQLTREVHLIPVRLFGKEHEVRDAYRRVTLDSFRLVSGGGGAAPASDPGADFKLDGNVMKTIFMTGLGLNNDGTPIRRVERVKDG